jgi:hypothetical protein
MTAQYRVATRQSAPFGQIISPTIPPKDSALAKTTGETGPTKAWSSVVSKQQHPGCECEIIFRRTYVQVIADESDEAGVVCRGSLFRKGRSASAKQLVQGNAL